MLEFTAFKSGFELQSMNQLGRTMLDNTMDQSASGMAEFLQQPLLDFAISQSSAMFYIADVGEDCPLRFITANVETITGFGPLHFVQDSAFKHKRVHEDDKPGYRLWLGHLPEGGRSIHEYRFQAASGELRWFRDECRLVESSNTPAVLVGCITDITAERFAAQSLTDSEALKSAIVEATQDAIVAIDAEGLVVDFNAKAEKMFDYRRNDVRGCSLSELIIPERLRAAHNAGLRRLRESSTSHMLNERVRLDAMRADGSEFPVELTVAQTTIHDQRIYVAEIRDVSEKAAAEAEKERLLQLLDDAVESLPNGFTLWDSNNRLVLANSAFGRSYGLDPAELKGLSRKEVVRLTLPHIRAVDGVAVENSEQIAASLARKYERRGVQSTEIELRSGQYKLVTIHEISEGGQVGVSADITALKQKERVLEESERRFRMLVESHPLPVWLIDLENGRILYSSPAIAELTGEEWSQTDESFVHDYYVNEEDCAAFFETIGRTGELRNQEVCFRRADGSAIWVSMTSRLLALQGRDLVITSLGDLTDQRNREAELRQARETLEDAIESLSEGLALYDAEDRLVMCNSQYRSFHRESEDLLVPGVAWPELTRARGERGLFTRARGGLEEWLEDQLAQRGTATNEEFPFAGDRWFEYSHRPTRQGGFLSSWRDITERKAMEQTLRESEALIRQILEASPLPVRMWNLRTGKVVYESPACQAMFGCDATKLDLEARLSFYVNLRDREKYLARLQGRGAVDNMEIQFRRADGSTFWASVSGRLVEFEGDQVVVSSIVDLSERKEMEQALRESEEMVRRVLEACPVPITMNRVDDGVIIYESPAAQALLRYKEPQDGESVVSRWVDPDDRQAYIKRLRRKGAVDGLEIRYKKADGEEFWCALSSRLIDYRGEKVIVSNLYDLTDRRAAECELARQRELLHQSEKLSALGELLAGVSHELNNPLLVLVGQAQMLQDAAPDEGIAMRADKIAKAAERCARIVKAFLAMARQEPSEIAPVEVNAVVESALELTGYSLRTQGIDVSLKMARDLPTVEADPDQLRQVFTNLIVNAQHALQDVEGSRRLRITSSYRKKSEQVVIKVKDNGPGIPAEIRTRIFEPLFTTKEIGAGTGMGLALCHRIVEGHGGTITIESPPGEGAAFSIRLPCGSQEEGLSVKAWNRKPKAEAFRVLVVDDDYDVCQVISDILKSDGHLVEIAGSGTMALEMAKRQHYDVILSDVRMPGMDGAGFYRALSKTKPEQIDGLVFMTGDTLSPKVREFLDASERPYLEKPLMARDILELMDLLLRRKSH